MHEPHQGQPQHESHPPWFGHLAQRLHPRWSRVEPAFPGVNERHQTGVSEVSLAVEPAVIGDELGKHLGEERIAILGRQGLRHVPGGHRRQRRLGDARRRQTAGSMRVLDRFPDSPATEVVVARRQDHVRQHAVRPLAAKQRAQLTCRAARIDASQADGDEARIP